jgi:hypothetical protein
MHADILKLMASMEAISATLLADLLELGKVAEEHFAEPAN